MKTRKLIVALTLLSFASMNAVFAASETGLGTTSTGTADITLEVEEVALLEGMADFTASDFTYSGGTADMVAFKNVCVYTNDSGTAGDDPFSGNYRVNAHGSGAASAFTVTDGAHTIAYSVKWNDAVGGDGTSLVKLVENATVFTNAHTVWNSSDCGADNASYEVTFLIDDVLDKPAGTYTGTLTIVVAPDHA